MKDVVKRDLEILASPEFEQISIAFAKAFAIFTAEMLHHFESLQNEKTEKP